MRHLVAIALFALSNRAAAQSGFDASAGVIQAHLTVPDGVTAMKAVLAFSSHGLAIQWSSSPEYLDLAKRLGAGVVLFTIPNNMIFGPAEYPGRCAAGDFDLVLHALAGVGKAAGHPELANAPMVLLGHADGGDYWNWWNACHPERVAMVYVHASGGVNYGGSALTVPVMYELGTDDLIEHGSRMPRAGMFANRIARGATMSLVLAQGQPHEQPLSAESTKLVLTMIEGIVRLRLPAGADPAAGPVRLNRIDESSGDYWLGDLYSKQVAPYAGYKGDKALTVFLPSEEAANFWKVTGPPLPASIKLPNGDCGWCGHPRDEPRAPPPAASPPSALPDAAAPPAVPDSSVAPDDAAAGPVVLPDAAPPAPSPPAVPARKAAGGCAVGAGPPRSLLLALLALCLRPRRRSGRRS
jgi:hypothetical protein